MKHILALTFMFALSPFVMGCGDSSAPDSNKPAPTPELGEASSDPSLMDDAATNDAAAADADGSDSQTTDENADDAAKEAASGKSIPNSPPDAKPEPPAQTSQGNSKPVETEVIEDDKDEEE